MILQMKDWREEMSTDLKNYLKNIYELEKFLYTQKLLKNRIEKKIESVKEWRPQEKISLQPKDYVSIKEKFAGYIIFIVSIVAMGWVGIEIVESGFHDTCITWFTEGFGKWWEELSQIIRGLLVLPLGIVVIACALVFWFKPVAAVLFGVPMGLWTGRIICCFLDGILYKKYSEQYAAKIKIKNKNIENSNNMMRVKNTNKIKALENELEIIKNEISNAEKTLNKFYGLDIIFSKYRNFVAVSSIYEYFLSGRCSSLTGHEGAYNIYETEVRLNIIVTQLSEIISQLKKIEKNQYMIYSAIVEANATVKQVSTQVNVSLDRIGQSTEELSEMVKISEYNNRIIAQNTEFIKWLKIFELESSRRNWK